MKQIPRFPNYFITNTGQVWSIKRDKWLKPFVSNSVKKKVETYIGD